MTQPGQPTTLEQQIAEWRGYRRRDGDDGALPDLEARLRAQLAALTAAGLTPREAFIVALKRVADVDAPTRAFARDHAVRLWIELAGGAAVESGSTTRSGYVLPIGLAVAAAAIVKIPALFGLDLHRYADVYARNAAVFVLPLLVAYFGLSREPARRVPRWIAVLFVGVALFANVYPFVPQGSTEVLTALHAAILLWLTVGVAYTGARWRDTGARMDFVRFSGELFIQYVLIALGGGVLTAFMGMIFRAIGLNAEPFFQQWLLPCGAAGAVLIAAWLVDARQGMMQNMAPVLARIFAPLFTALMLTFLVAVLVTGRGVGSDRDVLIAFDLLLAVVLALLLYTLSSRDSAAAPGLFDWLQVALLVSALLVDAVALSAIAARISAFGFTANRVAALGENVILLVNLVWAAVLHVRFARGRTTVAVLERWQTRYLPVYAAWAAVVIVVFPPLFHYA